MQNSRVILVDDNDSIINEMDIYQAHENGGQLHRAISVYLFKKEDNKIKLLIQQRSEKKIVGALLWANTVCGHVRSGESYLDCAKRRLKFELRIENAELREIDVFQYQTKCDKKYCEKEIDHVFVGWHEGQVKPNPDEVNNYAWVEWGSEIKKTLAPWFKLMLNKKDLIIKINKFLKL